MLDLARALDLRPRGRCASTCDEQHEIKDQSYAQIAKARFALEGASELSRRDVHAAALVRHRSRATRRIGKHVPPYTDLGGLYRRSAEHDDHEPFNLPQKWVEGKGRLNMATPYNFVTDCDIIGGNSGSPTVNKAGEFVGIIFDGNLQSLPLDYAYSDKQARAVSVDSRAILEALEKVYDAGPLAAELTGKH